jgi:hypothetical protein
MPRYKVTSVLPDLQEDPSKDVLDLPDSKRAGAAFIAARIGAIAEWVPELEQLTPEEGQYSSDQLAKLI